MTDDQFDQTKYATAWHRFHREPLALEDADLVQLEYVGLRDEAITRRDDARRKADASTKPRRRFVTRRELDKVVAVIAEIVGTEIGKEIHAAHARIATLETDLARLGDRILDLEAQRATEKDPA